MTADPNMPEACGAWMVTEVFEGLDARVRWCERTAGPCPFPGARPAVNHGNRRCGALPGKVLYVTYGEDVLRAAAAELDAFAKNGMMDAPLPPLRPETVYVALDALRACLDDKATG